MIHWLPVTPSPLRRECWPPAHSNSSFHFPPSSHGIRRSPPKALRNSGISSPRVSPSATVRPSNLPLPPWIRRLNWPSANAGETQHRPRTDSNGFFLFFSVSSLTGWHFYDTFSDRYTYR